jgi:hypothetical protein
MGYVNSPKLPRCGKPAILVVPRFFVKKPTGSLWLRREKFFVGGESALVADPRVESIPLGSRAAFVIL